MKRFFVHGRADLLAGLAVVLPVAVSIAVVVWLFGTISRFTDVLLLLMPKEWTRTGEGSTPLHWSILALAAAILLIGLVGRFGRYCFGQKLIRWVDLVLVRVPLLNRIYAALKQIHDAFISGKATSFKQVVLVEFPRTGLHSIGFITGEQIVEVQAKTHNRLLSVFVPTPPLTSGSVVLVPERDVIVLEMSVADGVKFIMSLGSVSPKCLLRGRGPITEVATGDSTGVPTRRNGEVDWSPAVTVGPSKPAVPSGL